MGMVLRIGRKMDNPSSSTPLSAGNSYMNLEVELRTGTIPEVFIHQHFFDRKDSRNAGKRPVFSIHERIAGTSKEYLSNFCAIPAKYVGCTASVIIKAQAYNHIKARGVFDLFNPGDWKNLDNNVA